MSYTVGRAVLTDRDSQNSFGQSRPSLVRSHASRTLPLLLFLGKSSAAPNIVFFAAALAFGRFPECRSQFMRRNGDDRKLRRGPSLPRSLARRPPLTLYAAFTPPLAANRRSEDGARGRRHFGRTARPAGRRSGQCPAAARPVLLPVLCSV